jgi:hypothetical protein
LDSKISLRSSASVEDRSADKNAHPSRQMSAFKDAGANFGAREWSQASSCSAAAETHA